MIPTGQAVCSCGGTPAVWIVARDTTLFLSFMLLVLLFVATGFAARAYRGEEAKLAGRWFGRGQTAMAAGRAQEAIQDFRTALVYSRGNVGGADENSDYELSLARALEAAGRVDEARAYLLGLAERTPGSATLNLELAHLAVRKNDVAGAIYYFTGAIYGVWDADPATQRRNARIEFAEFLIAHGRQSEAQAELLALAAALPADSTEHAHAGTLLLNAGENEQALKEFQLGIEKTPRLPEAEEGAGVASYQLGDYVEAERYLDRASRLAPLDDAAKQMLETSRQVLALDPLAEGLSAAERAERAAGAFEMALARLKSCASSRNENLQAAQPATPFQQLYAQAQKESILASETALKRHPENMQDAMNLAFQMEAAATGTCGPSSGSDLALELIGRRHEGAAR